MNPGRQEKLYKVYDDYGGILLVTSSRQIASWYQYIYRKDKRKITEKINIDSDNLPFKNYSF